MRDGPRDDDHAVSADLLAAELERLGHGLTWLSSAYFTVTIGGQVIGFWCSRTSLVSAPADMSAQRKDLANRLLRDAGFPVVDARPYRPDERLLAVEEYDPGVPVVVKPARGSKGHGVTVEVMSATQLEAAIDVALDAYPFRFLVESTARGREVRFLVVTGETVAATEKIPPRVVGDGEHDITGLVTLSNDRRADNPHLAPHPIHLDERRIMRLDALGLGPRSVPADGEVVRLDPKASLAGGGATVDVTDTVHPGYARLAERVTAAFPGLGVAGVDLVIDAPLDEPPDDDRFIVLEVNSMPGLGPHHFPLEGEPRNVARIIVERTIEATSG